MDFSGQFIFIRFAVSGRGTDGTYECLSQDGCWLRCQAADTVWYFHRDHIADIRVVGEELED